MSRNIKGDRKVNTAEIKITIILCYYAVLIVISVIYLATSDLDAALTGIQQYFICEGAGSGLECDRSSFNQTVTLALATIVYIMLGFVPAFNLAFVINWTATKKYWWRLRKAYSEWNESYQSTIAGVPK